MADYTRARTMVDSAVARVDKERSRIEQASTLLGQAIGSLTELQTAYAAAFADIDAQVTATPADELWAVAQKEKDALLLETTALIADATSKKTAIDSK